MGDPKEHRCIEPAGLKGFELEVRSDLVDALLCVVCGAAVLAVVLVVVCWIVTVVG